MLLYSIEDNYQLLKEDFHDSYKEGEESRSLKYDLDKLYTENMYLLYPLQLFKLRKAMERISISRKSEEQKQKEMVIIHVELKNTINKTLQAIDKAYSDGKINIEEI